jgi:tRNA-2-methylthio-N6-dimethylallyladenosine synthase
VNIKSLYIHTIGCQMNVYDSDRILSVLSRLNYGPAASVEDADVIIVNTCAIRAKAEQKVFSFLGRLDRLKKKKPDLIIGVGGCLAQQEGEKIVERAGFVDLVFGPHSIDRLPDMISLIIEQRCRVVNVEMQDGSEKLFYPGIPDKKIKAPGFVTIMQGCDNYCTYCVVPYVRGRETSRDPENIIEEIKILAGSGVQEVTLLGQNVNSYGKKQGLCSFSTLLSMVNEINGISRIRFTTSHPKDLSQDLIDAFSSLEKVCHHIHLPVQSGSDQILKKMNRKYTRSLYLEKIEKLREACPDIAISSDFIVGFPGESEADFEQTLSLITRVEYDSLFAFQYSDRPGTKASGFSDKVLESEKRRRLQLLLNLQESITRRSNQAMVGSIQQVLSDGLSKMQNNENTVNDPVQWTGRTSGNKIVNFVSDVSKCPDKEDFSGKMIYVKIERAFSHSLQGRVVS